MQRYYSSYFLLPSRLEEICHESILLFWISFHAESAACASALLGISRDTTVNEISMLQGRKLIRIYPACHAMATAFDAQQLIILIFMTTC